MRLLILGEEDDKTHLDPLVAKLTNHKLINGTGSGARSKHNRHNSRRKSSYDEEEIDDDEEEALAKVTSIFSNGSLSGQGAKITRKSSTASNTSSTVSLTPITQHIQQQAVVSGSPVVASSGTPDHPSITITSTSVPRQQIPTNNIQIPMATQNG